MSIKNLMTVPLSNFDLSDLNKDINSTLGESKNLKVFTVEEMIRSPETFLKYLKSHGFTIIFVNPDGQQIGHWLSIWTNKTGNYYFDSYGLSPQKSDVRLNSFLHRYLPNIKWNGVQYQAWKPEIATCGRWAMLTGGLSRIIPELNLTTINTIMKALKKKTGDSYDKIVTKLVNEQL